MSHCQSQLWTLHDATDEDEYEDDVADVDDDDDDDSLDDDNDDDYDIAVVGMDYGDECSDVMVHVDSPQKRF